MSGVSGTEQCPRCEGANFQTYQDWRPTTTVSGICLDCGFKVDTVFSVANEEYLSEERLMRFSGEDPSVFGVFSDETRKKMADFDDIHIWDCE